MATEVALEGLYVGADCSVVYSDASSPLVDMSGWTVVLDIRKKDTSPDPAKLSVMGTVSGTYSATASLNTQVVTFPMSDDDLSSSVFPGDDWTGRYSIKRTDAGGEQPLAYGPATITRVTQT